MTGREPPAKRIKVTLLGREGVALAAELASLGVNGAARLRHLAYFGLMVERAWQARGLSADALYKREGPELPDSPAQVSAGLLGIAGFDSGLEDLLSALGGESVGS